MQPFYSPKNVGIVAVLIALLLVIPIGLRLNQQSQSTQSQAAPESARVPGTSLSLIQHKFDCQVGEPSSGIRPSQNCNEITTTNIFAVDVLVNSDLDASNLIKTQLNFDPNKLAVHKIVTTNQNGSKDNFIIKHWVSNNYKNDKGTIALVGSVPDPGFTTTADKPALIARVYFKPLTTGPTTISFDISSSIYRSADNQNILSNTENINMQIR